MTDRQLTVYDELQAGRVPEDLGDGRHASPAAAAVARDASRRSPRIPAGRLCDWCSGPIPPELRADAECCGVVCRKRRHRFRTAVGVPPRAGTRPAHLVGPAARFAYADPPYPGKAGYYVERQEVDHRELIGRLEADYPDGWALSTSAAALRDVLPLCPLSVRVCVWRRRVRGGRSSRALSAWEPLLVVGGRPLATDEPQQLLDVLDYRGRYDAFPDALVGMKPPEFSVWLFQLLGAGPGDRLDDLFPGSGAVSRAWALYASRGDRAVDGGRVPELAEQLDGTRPASPAPAL